VAARHLLRVPVHRPEVLLLPEVLHLQDLLLAALKTITAEAALVFREVLRTTLVEAAEPRLPAVLRIITAEAVLVFRGVLRIITAEATLRLGHHHLLGSLLM